MLTEPTPEPIIAGHANLLGRENAVMRLTVGELLRPHGQSAKCSLVERNGAAGAVLRFALADRDGLVDEINLSPAQQAQFVVP